MSGRLKFFEHDLFPVFIFDGEVTRLKQSELKVRRKRRRRAAERAAKVQAWETRKTARYKARALLRFVCPPLRTAFDASFRDNETAVLADEFAFLWIVD